MENTYPFTVKNHDGINRICAEIESPALFDTFYPLFEKHDYEGNGYCWEGHITQILEKEDKSLLEHMDFDPEAGAFLVDVDTLENQQKVISILCPIFSNLSHLEEYIKSADRDRIDD